MKLETERLILHEIELTDLEKVHELHSLPETDRYNTLGIPETIDLTKELLLGWLDNQREIPRKKYVFSVNKQENEFIGLVGINIGKPKHKNAEIWFKLHLNYWNMGFATEMTNAILRFCFHDLELHRIEAGCAVENIASKNVLEKIGMTNEGLSRKILPIRGQWFDGYKYAILDTDYEKLKGSH